MKTSTDTSSCGLPFPILRSGILRTLVVGWLLLPTSVGFAEPSSNTDELVRSAIEFEIRGDDHYAEMLLSTALRQNPDHELANWRQGRIKVGNDWISVRDYKPDEPAWAEEYRVLRSQVTRDPAEEIQLAAWAHGVGAAEIARLHYLRVLLNSEADERLQSAAARAIGYRRYGNEWLSPEQFAELQAEAQQSEQNLRHWIPIVDRLIRKVEKGTNAKRDAALKEFDEQLDDTAISAMQWRLSGRSEKWSQWVVDHLRGMQSPAATISLMQHAVFAEWQSVRDSATQELVDRPYTEYMPNLLGLLESPVISAFEVSSARAGRVGHRHVFTQEQPEDVRSTVLNETAVPAGDASNAFAQQLMTGRASQMESRVNAYNAMLERRNQRIYDVLNKVSDGDTYDQTPSAWWDWWRRYNDYETVTYKPVRTETRSQPIAYLTPPPMPVSGGECFPAGTMVWTDAGPVAIQRIQVGDRVLSQDVKTGELIFKHVVECFSREADTVMLQAEEVDLVATLGHPIWVEGTGWRMARQLKEGDRLRTFDGIRTVNKLKESDTQQVFNLSVDGTRNYFVTNAGLLVHDNSYRDATREVTPGLRRTAQIKLK